MQRIFILFIVQQLVVFSLFAQKEDGQATVAPLDSSRSAKAKPLPDPPVKDLVHPWVSENCRFAFDRVDEFTGKRERGLNSRRFFTYTPESYEKFLKEEDFLTCVGYLSERNDGAMALHLRFKILSKTAKQKFGFIRPNSLLFITPMDGKPVLLKTFKGAKGEVVGEYTVYECSYALEKSDIKVLQDAEIDRVRVTWSEGYLDYEVYYLDFFIDQFPCFDEK